MKRHFRSFKKSVLAGTLFFLFGAGSALGQQTGVTVTLQNNSQQTYWVKNYGKLWFSSNDLVVNADGVATAVNIPLATIRKITFDTSGNTTSIATATSQNGSIQIYPNPAANYIDLDAPGATALQVRIYNTLGAQVAGGAFRHGGRVDISGLTPGLYVVIVNNQSFKLVKQ